MSVCRLSASQRYVCLPTGCQPAFILVCLYVCLPVCLSVRLPINLYFILYFLSKKGRCLGGGVGRDIVVLCVTETEECC